MSLRNRNKTKHGDAKSKSKDRNNSVNNKPEPVTTQPSYDIDLAGPGYFSVRLLASLIGYIMAIISYVIINALLTHSDLTRDKLIEFCVNNQKVFGFLFQPLISRQSLILPPEPITCEYTETSVFYNGITQFCIMAWLFHFCRRILEVLCIHKYHRSRPYKSIIEVSIYYTIFAIWVSISTHSIIYNVYLNAPQFENKTSLTKLVKLGLTIFIIGECGNSLHHYLLSKMRKKDVKGHVIPHKALFEMVSCPHYFFELISWFGFILISLTSIGSIAIFIVSTLILSRRAVVKHDKYIQEFGDLYPKNRCAIIPFLL